MVGIGDGVIGSFAGRDMLAVFALEAYLIYRTALDW